jgi:hypothetical protein
LVGHDLGIEPGAALDVDLTLGVGGPHDLVEHVGVSGEEEHIGHGRHHGEGV